jgi:hypothetical protein
MTPPASGQSEAWRSGGTQPRPPLRGAASSRRSRFVGTGLTAVVGLVFGCDRESTPTGPSAVPTAPSFAVQDGAHAGNPSFFFLPPLVPDPAQHPDFSPGQFDPSVEPIVQICMLEGPECAATQPVGFPVVFTMFSASESESIQMSVEEEHYVVNWHARDFDLDPARLYRISVLTSVAPLGFADVAPMDSGARLRNATTSEGIGLVADRTLPIRFRIERDAVATIRVVEVITVQDAARVVEPIEIALTENIQVSDAPGVLPAILLQVVESVVVNDIAGVVPPVQIDLLERVTVLDAPDVLPATRVEIVEFIHVQDVPALNP